MPLTDPQAEPLICTQCGRQMSDGLYDSYAEHYYCDDQCYYDWADANYDIVTQYYAQQNVD